MRSNRIVLIVAILASFIAFVDGTIVNVALPSIERDLGGAVALQQWVVDAYLLTLGALILVAGSLSDKYGRIRVMRTGLVGFAVTSLLAAFAPNGEFLITARALQGAAAALLVPSSLALLTSTFKGPALSKAIGSWTAWTGLAFLIGPLVGGTLVDTLGWRWVFGIVVIPTVVAVALTMAVPPEVRPPASSRTRLDVVGACLAAVGLGGPVFALIEGQQIGFASPVVIIVGVLGVIFLISFFVWESRVEQPMLPLGLFRLRSFAVGNLATVGIYAAIGLGPVLITLTNQEIGRLPATFSALVTLPVPVFTVLLAGRFGALAGKYGPRLFMTIGPLLVAAGFLLMLTTREPLNVWSQIIPGMVLFGFGVAVTVAPLTSTVLSEIPEGESGIASAVNNAVSRVAGLVAVAFIGVILDGAISIAGFHRGIVVIAILLLLSSAVSLVGLSDHRKANDGAVH